MPDLLISLEILAGIAIGVVITYVLAIVVRRRTISRGKILTLCGLRRSGVVPWRLGLVRFGNGKLEWFTLGGISWRPRYRWARRELELGSPSELPAGSAPDVLTDPVGVSCRHGEMVFDLALQRPAYTALRAWLEAAPPGHPGAHIT